MTAEKAKEILANHEAGTYYVPDLLAVARQTLGLAGGGSPSAASTDEALAAALIKAVELKLPVPALKAWAEENKRDFLGTLQEAIQSAELRARVDTFLAGGVVSR